MSAASALRHLPNLLSLLRLAGAPALAAVSPGGAFLAVFAAAGATDILDGQLARRFGWRTELGARLDSAGDLAVAAGLAVRLARFRPDFLAAWWPGLAAVAAVRLASLAAAYVKTRRFAALHTVANKAAGAAIFAGLGALFLLGSDWPAAAVLAVAGLAAVEELVLWLLPGLPDLDAPGLAARLCPGRRGLRGGRAPR
jgi:CDP-diacylglycerol--glycerol-3-phosphate 3-phosphatidyltransferase